MPTNFDDAFRNTSCQQPGKPGVTRGFLLLDQGDGKRLALLLFNSVDDARAAQGALTPVGSEHTYALMTGPALGSLANVVIGDGVFGDPATP